MTNQNNDDDILGWIAPVIGFVGLLAGSLFFQQQQQQNSQNNLTNNNNNTSSPSINKTKKGEEEDVDVVNEMLYM